MSMLCPFRHSMPAALALRLSAGIVLAGLLSGQEPLPSGREPLVTPDLEAAIKREGLANSHAMAYLDHLTNQIGARLTASDNFQRACEWSKGEFEKLGLVNVHLEKWGEFPVGWNRGQWSGRVTKPILLELQVATEAWTAGTRGRQAGKVLPMPANADEIAKDPQSYRGVWLMQSRGRAMSAPLRTACEEAGVLGFLRSGFDGDQTYPNRLRVFGSQLVKWDKLPKLPEIAIRSDQWNQIKALADKGETLEAEFDIRNQWKKGPIDVHNVVAELPGSEKPDEVVVVCGHLDSWHQATGTTDNGTGATSTLEAARILTAAGAKPKRTIRFILWGGEEQGLLGSLAHVNKRRAEMANVSCVFNHDTGTNWAHSLTVTEGMKADMERVFAPVMTMSAPDPDHEGPVFKLSVAKTISGGGGSDHASFARAGVPPFAWGLKGRSDYFRYTWHSQWDTFDVAIPEYQRHTSTVIALAALGVANLPTLLDRSGVTINQGASDPKAMVESMLGVEIDENKVKTVKGEGIAQKAGFRAGDVIVAIGDFPVETLREVRRGLREQDGPWTVTVDRAGEKVKLKLERPAAAASQPGSPAGNPGRRGGEPVIR